MLNVLEFKAAIVRKGFTQGKLAKYLGISKQTFCSRIKNKRFKTEEIEKMIPLLEISDPMRIFFDGVVASIVTEKETDEGEREDVNIKSKQNFY